MLQSLDDFIRQWIGQRVADSTLAGELPPEQWYQCVSLVKQYLRQCYGIEAGYWGNADAYWTIQHPEIQAQFDYVATQEVQKGDITPLTRTHIGIATGNVNSTQFEMLEQNGQTGNGSGLEGDAIRTRWIPKSRILGVIRPRVTEVPVQPPTPKFTVVEAYDAGKQIQLNKQPTYLWGMNYDFDFMKDNPVETHNAGEIWTVTNKVHHVNGYDYYRRDGQVDGFNVLDCDDYTPPPPAPYVPPAAPVKGTLAKKYTVKTTIMQFEKAQDAIFHNDAKGTVQPGDYYEFATQDSAIQLGTDNMTALYWVNTKDDVAPVAPQKPAADDWKQSFTPLYPDGKSRRYIAQLDMYLFDLAATDAKGINIGNGEAVPIYGSVQKSGMTYLVPRLSEDTVEGQIAPKEHWYGIPTTSVYTGLPNMKSASYIEAMKKAEEENRVYRKSKGHETTEDRVYYAEQLITRAVKDGVRFIDGIIGPKAFDKIKAAIGRKDNKNK